MKNNFGDLVTVIACLLARKCRPKSLSRDVIVSEIINIMKVEQYIARRNDKLEFSIKKWEIFEGLK